MQNTGGVHASGSDGPARRTNRFPKGDRVLRRADFVSIYEKGIKRHGRYVVAFGLSAGDRSRLGVTVTRKFGKAHDRNLQKRRIREIWRTRRHEAGLDLVAIDIVINVKNAAANASFAELSTDVLRVLGRLASDLRGSA